MLNARSRTSGAQTVNMTSVLMFPSQSKTCFTYHSSARPSDVSGIECSWPLALVVYKYLDFVPSTTFAVDARKLPTAHQPMVLQKFREPQQT